MLAEGERSLTETLSIATKGSPIASCWDRRFSSAFVARCCASATLLDERLAGFR